MAGFRQRTPMHDSQKRRRPRLLGVLLCYNDGDLVADAVRYLLDQGHDVIAWDHGSDDQTADVLWAMRGDLVELRTISREFDFYRLYGAMSRHLMADYVDRYDWISWPDQDEFLEGPDRSRPYRDWLEEAFASPYDWIEFRNVVFWWTDADDPSDPSVLRRVRHYSVFPDCSPRIRSWRSVATNLREFNHNPPEGERYPAVFNLRHYPMRSRPQMDRRIRHDRSGLERNGLNYHYENMSLWPERLVIPPQHLHFDEGGELDLRPVFDWRHIYGTERVRGYRGL
jgi:hypothetical protein